MKYLIAFLIAAGLIVLAIVIFVSGGSKKSIKSTPSVASSYASGNTMVQETIDGPIVASQTHQAVQISVNNASTSIAVLQGYDNTVVNSANYINTQTAYTDFLKALDTARFTKVRSTSQTDERGICPLGDRYTFTITSDGKTVQQLWSTSCGGQGTFGGNLALTLTLFQQQIPDYQKLTANVNVVPQGSLSF